MGVGVAGFPAAELCGPAHFVVLSLVSLALPSGPTQFLILFFLISAFVESNSGLDLWYAWKTLPMLSRRGVQRFRVACLCLCLCPCVHP